MRGLETGVRNSKDKPAARLQNASYSLKDRVKINNIGQRHDADTACKLAVAQRLSTLGISVEIHNPQWLLLFIASSEGQQVRCQIKASDLRPALCQLTRHPALPA